MPVTSCTEFKRRLHEAVENRRAVEAADIAGHAACCAACGRLLEEHALLERAVGEWARAATLDVDLTDAVLARLAFSRQDSCETIPTANRPVPLDADVHPQVRLLGTIASVDARRAARSRVNAAAVLAVAAAALLLAFWPFGRPAVESQPPGQPAVPATMAADDSAEVDVAHADVEGLVRDAGSAYLELARGAADVFTDTVVLIPAQPLPSRELPRDADEAPIEGERARYPGRELEPIGRGVGQAIDFLFNTIAADAGPAT